ARTPGRSGRGRGAAARGRAGARPRRVWWSPMRSCHVALELPSAAGVFDTFPTSMTQNCVSAAAGDSPTSTEERRCNVDESGPPDVKAVVVQMPGGASPEGSEERTTHERQREGARTDARRPGPVAGC